MLENLPSRHKAVVYLSVLLQGGRNITDFGEDYANLTHQITHTVLHMCRADIQEVSSPLSCSFSQ